MLRPILDVSVSRKGVVNRRGFMKRLGGGVAVGGAMTVGWRDMLMAQAAELQKRWDYAQLEASKEGMATLEKLCKEYDQQYMNVDPSKVAA